MKNVKKLMGLLLAMIMAFAMGVCVFAEGTNTITISNAQKGETYKLYKILNLSVSGDKTAYSYTLNDTWKSFFTQGNGVSYVDIDTQNHVTWKVGMNTAENMENFGKAAAAYAANVEVTDTKTPTTDGQITFSGLDSGYYLITSTNGTLAMTKTTPSDPDVTVNEKNKDTTLDKKVQEDSTDNWGNENSAQIGDTVNFKVTIHMKKGAKNYVMHETMDDGLSFNEGSVQITGLTKDTDYTVKTAEISDGCTFEIIFTKNYLNSVKANTALTVTYNAVLNENADITNGENNKAKITWGDNSTTEYSETTTKTYQFEVLKYAQEDEQKNRLAGAVFQLLNAENEIVKLIKVNDTEYRVANGGENGSVDSFTTVANGNIVIKGVDLDKYYLKETKAPEGYNLLADDKEFTVTSGNTLTVEIENKSGSELPETGGMGTTMFYLIGGILVIGAGVLLVARRRAGRRG